MKSVLLTGANGFIGKHFSQLSKELKVSRLSFRTTEEILDFPMENYDTVLHLAGIAHRMDMPSGQIYFDVNQKMTLVLARKAKEAGIKHFIFASSIKVYGNEIQFIEKNTQCIPDDDYGKSKFQAEQELRTLETEGFKLTIIRIPVVYGPGVKGNIEKIVSLCKKALPIPLGGISNNRSMIFIGNLVAYFHFVIEHQISGTYLPSDKSPISTSFLVREILSNLNKTHLLMNSPKFIRYVIRLLKPGLYIRLFGSYEVSEDFQKELGFEMPYTSSEGIASMF